jgi:hypothetical protein
MLRSNGLAPAGRTGPAGRRLPSLRAQETMVRQPTVRRHGAAAVRPNERRHSQRRRGSTSTLKRPPRAGERPNSPHPTPTCQTQRRRPHSLDENSPAQRQRADPMTPLTSASLPPCDLTRRSQRMWRDQGALASATIQSNSAPLPCWPPPAQARESPVAGAPRAGRLRETVFATLVGIGQRRRVRGWQ